MAELSRRERFPVMHVILTGASSFTGFWFAREIAARGHSLTMPLRRSLEEYSGLRRERVEALRQLGRVAYACEFGTDAFLSLLASERPNVLCHHAAVVENYKSADFDVIGAVAANACNLASVLSALAARDCNRVIITGSVFEPGEGAGSDKLAAVSPYGFSKGLTSDVFRYYCAARGVRLGKFVIPNPFGPFEDAKFTTYLAKTWLEGGRPLVSSPAYVRDNIHVGLLAKAYVHFLERFSTSSRDMQANPSGYIETQGRFAMRFASELEERLGVPCQIEMREQDSFLEPAIRVNTEPVFGTALGWDERAAWRELAEFYVSRFKRSES